MTLKEIVEKPLTEADIRDDNWENKRWFEVGSKMIPDKVKRYRLTTAITNMFVKIEQRDMIVSRLEMNLADYALLVRYMGKDTMEISSAPVTSSRGMATIWGAPVYANDVFDEVKAYGNDEIPPITDDGILWIRDGWEVKL